MQALRRGAAVPVPRDRPRAALRARRSGAGRPRGGVRLGGADRAGRRAGRSRTPAHHRGRSPANPPVAAKPDRQRAEVSPPRRAAGGQGARASSSTAASNGRPGSRPPKSNAASSSRTTASASKRSTRSGSSASSSGCTSDVFEERASGWRCAGRSWSYHGGQITAHSTPGHGSVVRDLVAGGPSQEGCGRRLPDPALTPRDPDGEPAMDDQRIRILLVEDDPDDVWVMRSLLGDRWDGPFELVQVELLSAAIDRCSRREVRRPPAGPQPARQPGTGHLLYHARPRRRRADRGALRPPRRGQRRQGRAGRAQDYLVKGQVNDLAAGPFDPLRHRARPPAPRRGVVARHVGGVSRRAADPAAPLSDRVAELAGLRNRRRRCTRPRPPPATISTTSPCWTTAWGSSSAT